MFFWILMLVGKQAMLLLFPKKSEINALYVSLERDLLDEWKTLQGKIDSIGEFKFNVRNWAFTLTVAIMAGIYVSGKGGLFHALALFPAALFWVQEHKQKKLSKVFKSRIERIETAIDRIRKTAYGDEYNEVLKSLERTPGLAKDIKLYSNNKNLRKFKLFSKERRDFFLSKYADKLFYWGLMGFVGIAILTTWDLKKGKLGEQNNPAYVRVKELNVVNDIKSKSIENREMRWEGIANIEQLKINQRFDTEFSMSLQTQDLFKE